MKKRPLLPRFEAMVTKTEACWLWGGAVNKGGYGVFQYEGKPVSAHRMAYLLYCGPIPEDLHVLHSCDVRRCVFPDHLRLGTPKENMADRQERNPIRGITNGRAKLDSSKVQMARQLLAEGIRQRDIAALLGVSKYAIWSLSKGKTWSHV